MLQAAAAGGHLQVVERLLAAKADVNAPAGSEDGRTTLQAAADGGHGGESGMPDWEFDISFVCASVK